MAQEVPSNTPPSNNSPENPSPNPLIRYSGLGFQMLATIIACIWLGRKMDKWLGQHKFPLFTVILLLLGVIGSLVSLVRGLNQQS
jgi:ATP synthase protein I